MLQKKKILQMEMKRKVIDTKEQAAIGIDRIKKFWRSQIMEGNSRAGKILRAALLQNILISSVNDNIIDI